MVIVNTLTSLSVPKVYFCNIKTCHLEEIISENLEFINTSAYALSAKSTVYQMIKEALEDNGQVHLNP